VNNNVATLLQILSILVSGGALQFVTFLIKRADDIRKLGKHNDNDGMVARPTQPGLLFVSEKDLVSKVLAYEKQLTIMKTKLRKCRKDLTVARKNDR
jgi:hypothetical protein